MITEYEPAHFDGCVELFCELFKKPPFEYNWLTEELASEYLMDMINTPKSRVFVYKSGGDIIGVCFGACYYCGPYPSYEIKEIFVSSESQRRGVGTLMLSGIERKLKKSGIALIRLATLSTIPAYDFYIKNGYSENPNSVIFSKVIV